jgi:Tol biopolymer transport system component
VRAPDGVGTGWEAALRAGAVFGRFELVREVGRGGFGVVWEARDLELGRRVAFKAVRRGARPDLRRERLLLEAEAAARCSHPNIVTLHDVGRCEHGPYLVLEFLRGETLGKRLEAGPLPVREAVRIGVEVAKGLAHAHARGVVHRDLTPGNVFLCQSGLVKVLDLGLAHAFGRRKAEGGTRAYMAPEQVAGAPEDERTDVFALGMVLYRMLTGALPLSSGQPVGEPVTDLEVPAAPGLGDLLTRMLMPDAAARVRDGGAALAELERIAAELPREPPAAAIPETVQPAGPRLPGRRGRGRHDLRSEGCEPPWTPDRPARQRRWTSAWLLGATGAVLAAALTVWQARERESTGENPLSDARFLPLTDFEGIEQAAAISRDGRFVAFQSDRDGRMDVWVTQVGTGQFANVTRGAAPEIVNPSVRTLGFSPDGSLVTFWARGPDGSGPPDIGIRAVPLLGGRPRPYLDGAAELDWSPDEARLVYHTPGPGDPMYVRDSHDAEARQIFTAPSGLHGHFILWSPDQAFIYFVQGSLPDRLDLWRIRPTGGPAERITHHESLVSHPVFLNARTLLYLASDKDGSGPWIYSVDPEKRVSRRVSTGIDSYTSLAASADGHRVVATVARPKSTLWRVPVTGTRADWSAARRIPLSTGNGSSPRLGPGYLLYVSSRGASDSIWKLEGDVSTELWSASDARIIGAPAIRRDGRRIAFSIRQGGRTTLYAVNADGTDARIVTGTLELLGAPAWAPDGLSITVAALVDGAPRLFAVPLDGRAPAPFVSEQSVDPVWSPRGEMVAFTGADVGTTFPVRAVKADASPYRLPSLTLTRGARHLSFMPEGRSLLVLRGEIRHKNLWLIDLDSGVEHQITDLARDVDVRDFDVSPDGRELVLQQVQERSDIVLIEIPRR